MQCQKCGTGNTDGTKFCRGCGAPLAVPGVPPAGGICPGCGTACAESTKFCGKCGFRLHGEQASAADDETVFALPPQTPAESAQAVAKPKDLPAADPEATIIAKPTRVQPPEPAPKPVAAEPRQAAVDAVRPAAPPQVDPEATVRLRPQDLGRPGAGPGSAIEPKTAQESKTTPGPEGKAKKSAMPIASLAIIGTTALAVVGAAGWWWSSSSGTPPAPPEPAAATSAPVAAVVAPPAPTAPIAPTAEPPPPAADAMPQPAVPATLPAEAAADPAQVAEEARRKKAEQENARKARQEANQRASAKANQRKQEQAAREPAQPPAIRPVPLPQPAAIVAPSGPHSPQEACADRSNFVSRGLCETRACQQPEWSNHPFCVSKREALQRQNASPFGGGN